LIRFLKNLLKFIIN